MIDVIRKFCNGAENISINTKSIESLKDLQLKINPKDDEIYRSRYGKEECIFNLGFGFNKNTTLLDEIEYMETIELFYPNTFSWRFDGKHIEAIARIPIKKEHLGIFTRYKGIYEFIRTLRSHILDLLKSRKITDYKIEKYVKHMILATGSINNSSALHAVNIDLKMSEKEILIKSKNNVISNPTIKDLNMKFWVKEINPDFFKQFKAIDMSNKKYPIGEETYKLYPDCIKEIASMKKKGNYARYILSTFLLAIHNERDAKHQLDLMLSEEERNHINKGNCSQQWRTIVVKGYPAPSCKTMVENGFCLKGCSRPCPTFLKQEEVTEK